MRKMTGRSFALVAFLAFVGSVMPAFTMASPAGPQDVAIYEEDFTCGLHRCV